MRFIGSKNTLLNSIEAILSRHIRGTEHTFLDLFGGTNTVGNHFKQNFSIISNDFLYFSYAHAKAIIENNGNLRFVNLKKININSPLDYLQKQADIYSQENEIRYYEINYSPTGGSKYFSVENAKRIDFIRDKIDEWKKLSLLTELEYYYLVSCLIDAIPGVSNTTGTYGAYLKHWDKRATKKLELSPLSVVNNNRINTSYNCDANTLSKLVSSDIAYIDPPYNTRQYGSNYHVLENIAKNNKPNLHGKTRIFEWDSIKSRYSIKQSAFIAIKELIENIDASHIIFSYSNEGIVSEDDLEQFFYSSAEKGTFEKIRIPYKKYKSKIPSSKNEVNELLFYFQKKNRKKCTDKLFPSKLKMGTSFWIHQSTSIIKSPLNYIGGKYKLLKQMLPFFPDNINTFVDLFSGGANVGINVTAKRHIFNDINTKINDIFRLFYDSETDKILYSIKEIINKWSLSKTNENGFLAFRNYYNQNPDPLMLYVLASYSYNYQFRFNKKMEFNNPFGRNRSHFSKKMELNLVKFIERLHCLDAIFSDYQFECFNFDTLGQNDFVYLDPPYLITTGSYNDGNRGFKDWDTKQEIKLYNLLEKLSHKKIRFALSNVIEHKGKINKYLKEFISTNNYDVHYITSCYDNSSHNTKKKGSTEVLITNFIR